MTVLPFTWTTPCDEIVANFSNKKLNLLSWNSIAIKKPDYEHEVAEF
jgi:hypothetical protein